MARPRKDGLEYFSHDVHASSDKKVEALRMLYGNDGYAFYFILLETIYQEVDFELDVSDAETIQILCRKTELTPERFDMILGTALKRGCFDKDEYDERGVLTSNGIKKRAEVVVKKRVKMQETYKEKVSDLVSEAETQQKSTVSAPKVKESKVKEKKSKEDKVQYAEFVSMTLTEYEKLLYEHGQATVDIIISTLDNYKGSNGKKYASDYRAILTWVLKRVEEDRNKGGGNIGKYEGRSQTSGHGSDKKESKFAFLDINKPSGKPIEYDPTII